MGEEKENLTLKNATTKSGKIEKSIDINDDVMQKINKFTVKELAAEDVVVFKIAMCDDVIDRDEEKFTVEALKELATLFVGKTVITNHHRKSENQIARIYDTEVVSEDGETKLYGYIYTLTCNETFIKNVEGGIMREVSVSCRMGKSICSICGSNHKEAYCRHFPGREYEKDGAMEKCYFTLEDAKDAYELSFVAVPAQPTASVVKKSLENEENGEGDFLEIETKLKLFNAEHILRKERNGRYE